MEKTIKCGIIKNFFFEDFCNVHGKIGKNEYIRKKISYSNIDKIEITKGGIIKKAVFTITFLGKQINVQFDNKYLSDAYKILDEISPFLNSTAISKSEGEQVEIHSDDIILTANSICKDIEKKENITVNSEIKEKHYHIAGISHYKENIEKLGYENEEYDITKKEMIDDERIDERIYQYSFTEEDITLLEEPDNEYDENAIAVYMDNMQIGYIKKGVSPFVKKLIKHGKIISAKGTIKGGKYKALYLNEVEDKYEFENDKIEYSCTLILKHY